MRKIYVMVLVFFSAFICVSTSATPPTSIKLDYDSQRQELNVLVEHPVSRTKRHYINKVVVSKNGAEIIRKDFGFQTSHRNQTMTPFKIAAAPGDVFSVKADCSISGNGENTIIVK